MLSYILIICNIIGQIGFLDPGNLAGRTIIPVNGKKIAVSVGRAWGESIGNERYFIGKAGKMMKINLSGPLVSGKRREGQAAEWALRRNPSTSFSAPLPGSSSIYSHCVFSSHKSEETSKY